VEVRLPVHVRTARQRRECSLGTYSQMAVPPSGLTRGPLAYGTMPVVPALAQGQGRWQSGVFESFAARTIGGSLRGTQRLSLGQRLAMAAAFGTRVFPNRCG